jgi:endonuclease-3
MKSAAPQNWKLLLDTLRQFRATLSAPVDTMGCAMLYDRCAPPPVQRFHILVALMLSSQTTDQQTALVHQRLRTQLRGGLTPDAVLAVPEAELAELLRGVGFHKRKASYLQRSAALLLAHHGGDIPDSVSGLTALPGVGPKMAHLCMGSAWGKVEGIGVDVHVHRISQRLGWVSHTNQRNKMKKKEDGTPEETRRALEEWLPKEHWGEINPLLVGLGQTVCSALRPQCDSCGLKELCPRIGVRKLT